ncbi:MAG TPA: TolC family protein [Blastocatellia bacterium]|nr:TolC family protein [Blastocatellia bacterium]
MKKLISLNLLLIVASLTPAFKAAAQTPAAEPERRVGVRTSNRVSLTLREAVMMALENNRDIEIERLNARMNEFDLRAARGHYDPALTAGVFYDHRVTPVASLLAGGADGSLKTTDFAGTSKITQRLPWQGGRVQAVFDQSRATSQNLFNALNPQFTTGLSVEFAQPLFRDRRIDEPRRQIKIAKKRLDLSDSQFRQRAIEIVAQVERAYWDLVFALRDEEIKRESVELARSQLAHNQRLVQQGAIAQVDVVSARVEVERRTDEAEAAVETIQRAENALKALTLAPGATEMWSAALTPVEKPELDSSAPMPFDDALKIAFKNRPEMEQFRLRGELNNIDVDYFRDQTKPRIDLIASYGTFGLAGKERRDLNPISASQEQLFARVNRLSQIAGLPALPPFPFGAPPEKFIGGYGQSLGNLFRNDYRAWRVGVNIELSLGNRTAKARMGRALVEGKQIDAQRQRAEQLIEVEVRNALQAVETARRRVEAAKNSRANAELQHASERRKFDAGQSTNFFVLDRQNALSAARGRELKALTDYNKAVSELQSALSTTLVNNNVAVAGPPVRYRER